MMKLVTITIVIIFLLPCQSNPKDHQDYRIEADKRIAQKINDPPQGGKMQKIIYPYRIEYKEIDLNWMIGKKVTKIVFNKPDQWNVYFNDKSHISIECLWRIIKNNRVVLTGFDHEQQFGLPAPVDAVAKALQILSDKKISSVQIKEMTADITIAFSNELRLEVIPLSAGYESWQIYAPNGISYYAQGGGQLCKWQD
jgi:hypothetical protein